jgi:hypothetical protein
VCRYIRKKSSRGIDPGHVFADPLKLKMSESECRHGRMSALSGKRETKGDSNSKECFLSLLNAERQATIASESGEMYKKCDEVSDGQKQSY